MFSRWTIHAHPDTIRAIYRLPREIAVLVNESIQTLAVDPLPKYCEPVENEENLYQIHIQGYVVSYEVIEEKRKVRILLIGEG